jgi:hypothetical protein
MSRAELEAVLDYILNKAGETELEVVAKACERRIRDRTAFASLGGEGPAAMARRLAEELQRGVGATMEDVRSSVRDFVADIVRKNAPEIGEAELLSLLADYVPGPGTRKAEAPAESLLPPAALLGMVRSFVEFSESRMPPSRQAELWESNPRWQDEYWKAFPAKVKALVKAYIDGKIDGDTFGTALLTVLGL